MIAQLIDLFDVAVASPVATKHGLATLGPDGPIKHAGGSQYTPIAVDNTGPWSYWRVGNIQSTPADIYTCEPGALHKVTFRLVMLMPNDCGGQTVLLAAADRIKGATGAAKALLGATRVRVAGHRIAVDGVGQIERIANLPLQWLLIAMDVDLEILGTADCLVGCDDGPSVLCSIIGTATDAEVIECLGDRLNDICEGGSPCDLCSEIAKETSTPQAIVDCIDDAGKADGVRSLICDPTTVNGIVSDINAITVVQGGVEVGTLNPATGVHTVPECPVPPVPECDDLVDAVVVEGAGTEVVNGLYRRNGEVNGLPLYESENGSRISSVDSAPDYTWNIEGPEPQGKYFSYDPFDRPWLASTWIVSSGADPVPTVRQATIADLCPCDECEPATVQLRDFAGNDIGVQQSYPPGSSNILTAPDGLVDVNSVPFGPVTSNGAINVPVKDGTGTPVGSLIAGEWIVPTRPPDGDAIIYRFGTILASGQTTVYRAGDEGTMQASGFFDYSPTIGPNSVLQDIVGFGTGGDWTTLKFNNIFGNTLRFTDRAGGAAASSGNRFIIDHLTNLEYYVLGATVVAADWEAAVDAGVAINATLGETGWFLPNDRVLDSITNDASSAFISAPPFSISTGGGGPLWTSSTSPGSSTAAKFLSISGGQMAGAQKTTNSYFHGIYVRRRP